MESKVFMGVIAIAMLAAEVIRNAGMSATDGPFPFSQNGCTKHTRRMTNTWYESCVLRHRKDGAIVVTFIDNYLGRDGQRHRKTRHQVVRSSAAHSFIRRVWGDSA